MGKEAPEGGREGLPCARGLAAWEVREASLEEETKF